MTEPYCDRCGASLEWSAGHLVCSDCVKVFARKDDASDFVNQLVVLRHSLHESIINEKIQSLHRKASE